MVSNARLDLPLPDSPVITTRRSRGNARSTSLRLCSRAPCTTIRSWGTVRVYADATISYRCSSPWAARRGDAADLAADREVLVAGPPGALFLDHLRGLVDGDALREDAAEHLGHLVDRARRQLARGRCQRGRQCRVVDVDLHRPAELHRGLVTVERLLGGGDAGGVEPE